MVYAQKISLRLGKEPLYHALEWSKGDKFDLWLKFYDESGECQKVSGEITVAGWNNGLLFKTEVAAAKNEEGFYVVPLNLNTVELAESTARSATVIVRFEEGE